MENKKSTNIPLAIMGVLIIVELIARIACFNFYPIAAFLQIITLGFVALYGFWFYKKPHGNILKYAMLLFAFANILVALNHMDGYDDPYNIIRIIACAAVCYGAGRLNKIEQNKFLFLIISIVFLVISIIPTILYPQSNVFIGISRINFSITFITLTIAYFTRFKAHKEAGLADAPAKQ